MTETVAVDQLKQYVDRINRLKHEITELNDDMKQVFDEAKSNGYDVKALKAVIKLMNADKSKLANEEAMIELYRGALGV